MPITVSSVLPLSSSMVAVIAAGDSMVPAGIASGHICYCDPSQAVMAGDAAYIVRKDGLATIKLFLGASDQGAGWVRFRGWLSPHGGVVPKDFVLDVLHSEITTLAPVIFVRRRI